MSDPVLVSTPLAHIVAFWRPGSRDWTWADEYADLLDKPVTKAVCKRVNSEGIGFLDHLAPVLLGSNGRVWDGHHRICIALEQCIPSLMVERADLHAALDPTVTDTPTEAHLPPLPRERYDAVLDSGQTDPDEGADCG